MVARTRPTVVVIGDDLLPAGEHLAADLRSAHPALGVVVVSHRTDNASFQRFRAAGASAFVSRSAPATAVLAAIRHAATQPDEFRAFGVPWTVEWEANRTPALSHREQQVLELLKDGRPAADIAASLQVGKGTVRTYVTRLYAKLGVSNRSQALVAAAADSAPGAPLPAPRSGEFRL
jgi:DNA-binding NarL/FixJ family response regulator